MMPDTLLLNRYKITREIGRGGMGAVYEALDIDLSRNVAIKETFAQSDEERRYFKREASLLANLRHYVLPKVMVHFEQKGSQFLVMEYIPGNDLLHILVKERKNVPFDIPEVMAWIDDLFDALIYLHKQKTPIIHRDIKPANMKLTPEGDIILIDFGLAKGKSGQMSYMSQSIAGYTPSYASLEQILRSNWQLAESLSSLYPKRVEHELKADTDPRSDLYSVGATLYHLLTGKPPKDSYNRAIAIWSGKPDLLLPPISLNPNLPDMLNNILLKAMALHREDRFDDAAQMHEEIKILKNYLSQTDDEITLVRTQTNKTKDGKQITPEPTIISSVEYKFGRLGKCDKPVRSIDFAENGRFVATGSNDNIVRVWDTEKKQNIVLGKCDDAASGFSYVASVAFTPNCRSVVSGSNDNKVRIWDINSKDNKIIANMDHAIRAVAVSPDGKNVAVGLSDGSLIIIDIRSGKTERLHKASNAIWCVAFAPSGRRVAFAGEDNTINVWEFGTDLREVGSCEATVRAIDFSHDGHNLVSGSDDNQIRIWDLSSGFARTLGACDRWVRSVAFSSDERVVFSAGDDNKIQSWNIMSGSKRELGACDDVVSCIACSPDGKAVASGSWDRTVRLWDVDNVSST